MKRRPGLEWLADLSAQAVVDTPARFKGALRCMGGKCQAGRKCGFSRPKKKFRNEAGIYCVKLATLNVKGMVKNHHLGSSVSDAGLGLPTSAKRSKAAITIPIRDGF